MKKWLIGTAIILFLLFLAGVSYFIPQKILLSRNVTAGINQQGLFRFLSNYANWKDWWPGKESHLQPDSVLRFNGYEFNLRETRYNAFQIVIRQNENTDTSILHLIPVGNDSTQLVWDVVTNTGSNPFIKINEYRRVKKIGLTLAELLSSLQLFSGGSLGVYGLDIKKEQVKIENVVSTKKVFSAYPDTESIYEMVNRLKEYARQHGAKEEDYPMLNITPVDTTKYLAQVGIPIDKQVPQKNNFFLKQMLKNGNILVGETKGGRTATDSAIKAMEAYTNDHNHFSIALPFLSLITDRTKEKDSSKWVTKIYYPVN